MPLALELEGFSPVEGVAKPGGVFCLCLAGKVVYVGKSKNLYMRLSALVLRFRRPIPKGKAYRTTGDIGKIPLLFDEVWVKFCDETTAAALEVKLIAKHRPSQQPPIRICGEIVPAERGRWIDLDGLAFRAGVKLERPEDHNRRVPSGPQAR